jgi:hypothetical protein
VPVRSTVFASTLLEDAGMALKQTIALMMIGSLGLFVAPASADAVGSAGTVTSGSTVATDTEPTTYLFDNHVRFIVGSQLSFDTGRWPPPHIAAWYGWTASDPDGICGQRLYSEEYTTDYVQFNDDVAASARRARFTVVTDNREDAAAGSYVDYYVDDCAGNQTSADLDAFTVDQLQEGEASYSGTWQTVHARRWSGGAGRTARAAGATATVKFWHSVGLVMPTGPGRGSFDLYVDGVFRRTVKLARATASVRRVVAEVDMGNSPGGHTAMLRTTSARPVTIDAAVIS